MPYTPNVFAHGGKVLHAVDYYSSADSPSILTARERFIDTSGLEFLCLEVNYSSGNPGVESCQVGLRGALDDSNVFRPFQTPFKVEKDSAVTVTQPDPGQQLFQIDSGVVQIFYSKLPRYVWIQAEAGVFGEGEPPETPGEFHVNIYGWVV